MLAQINSRLKQLGEFRDSFLVLAGSVYILGYIVRAINALRNNLGLLPAFESQYFIAGIFPAIVLVVFCILIWCVWQFKKRLPIWLDSGRYREFIVLLLMVTYLVTGGIFTRSKVIDKNIMMVGIINLTSFYLMLSFSMIKPNSFQLAWDSLRNKTKIPWFIRVILFFMFLITAISYSLTYIIDKIVVWIGRQINEMIDPLTLITVLFIVACTVIGLAFFVSYVYPEIPQELGGDQPRCAYLDIVSTEISPEFRSALFASDIAKTDIVRSVQLDVYFSSSEFILVKPHSKVLQAEAVTYEIQKNIIRAIKWCK